jgi:hypothetical protein
MAKNQEIGKNPLRLKNKWPYTEKWVPIQQQVAKWEA